VQFSRLAVLMTRFSPDRVRSRAAPRRTPAVVAVLLVAACGATPEGNTGAEASSAVGTTSTPAPEPRATPGTSSAAPAEGTTITTADSEFGPMLFDEPGQAIYLFDKETNQRPDCYGDCAAAWPPVLTSGIPQATGAVRAGLLGTVERDDGSMQVTYAGHPLYYYAHEEPGEVLCHDVEGFGGLWLVVTPDGTAAA
jgi:predicted lipoprotein with Yx(FWY)xxD motif